MVLGPVCTESMVAPKRDGIGAVLGFVTILVGVLFIKGGDNERGCSMLRALVRYSLAIARANAANCP